jgi:outer membrane protein
VPSTGIGVQLAVPLATGGVGQARIREADALADAARAQLDDATRVLQTELEKGYLDLRRTLEQWRIQTGVLATANASLAATRKAFDAGARSNIDLLNSQQLTFSTRRDLLATRIAVLSAQLRILSLVGDLDIGSLARLEAAFEARAARTVNAIGPRSTQ